MAEIAGVARNMAMECVNISLGDQGAVAFLAKVGCITAVAVGANAPGAKGDGALVMYGIGVVTGWAMANGAVPTTLVSCGAANQAEIGGAVAEVAVVLVDDANHVSGVGRVVASGTGGG